MKILPSLRPGGPWAGAHWPGKIRTAVAALSFFAAAALPAAPLITEFMASNATTLKDEDGDYSDWVEIHNPDATPVSLAGWHLTDNAANKTKWTFPEGVSIPANGYLLVWASNKNRGSATTALHTNFALSSNGEYLGLIQAGGTTVVSEFAPEYPPQANDTSYGVTQPTGTEAPQTGFLSSATPGQRNGGNDTLVTLGEVTISRPSGLFSGTITVELGGAAPGQQIRYVLNPPGAAGASVPAPDSTSPAYSGPIAVTGTYILKAAVFAGAVRGPVATAQYVRLGEDLASFRSEMPIMLLDNHGLGAMVKDEIDRDGWMHVFTPGEEGEARLTSEPALVTPMTFKVRGSSSAEFPKKGFNVELKRLAGGDNPQPLLGLPENDRWSIINPWFYDRSYMRNAFGYALSDRMGRWAPRTRIAETFVNANGGDLTTEDYHGIMIVTDRILWGEHRINLNQVSAGETTEPGITGAYIFKLDGRDEDEWGFITNRGAPHLHDTEFVVARPKAADLPQPHRDYIRNYIQRMEDAIYADAASNFQTRQYLDFIDVDSWIDQHLLNVFMSNADALLRSVYFTKDQGGKMVAGPAWDFDRSAGSSDARTGAWDTWAHTLADVWNHEWWGPLFRDPEFMQAWVDRWQSLRRGPWANSRLSDLVDQIAAQIDPAAAARDAAKWPDNRTRFGETHAGEVDYLRHWITQRAEWIDSQVMAVPSVAFTDGSIIITPPPGGQVVYTLDGSDPRASGGLPAAGSQVSAEPVVLPDSGGFRVRSYRPGDGRLPDTTWSSAIRLADISGNGRLINVSSRAHAGAGDDVLIAGLVVGGDFPARFLARAVGPALTEHGITATLNDPNLRLVRSDGTVIAENTLWSGGADAEALKEAMARVGAFALADGSRDAAVIAELPPGVYSVVVSDPASAGGIALAEIYELDGPGRAINLSTRARVRAGEGQLVGGLAIRGEAPKRVLIRAVGPTLARFDVAGALANPVLTVFRGQEVVATVDDWEATPELVSASAAAGAFALNEGSRDAAVILTLPPGNYTAMVTSADGAEGVALVEIYELP